MGGLYVVKRDGREEPVAFDKITARIKKLAYGLSQEFCDPVRGDSRGDSFESRMRRDEDDDDAREGRRRARDGGTDGGKCIPSIARRLV